MSEQSTQNFENHAMIDKFFIAMALIVFAGIVATIIGIVMLASEITTPVLLTLIGQLLLGVGLLGVQIRARQYGTKLQDRIIRTEMRMRLDKLGLGDKADSLTKKQFIGLRFASDGEIAGLIDKVLSENIASGKEIKKLVKDWQADNDRI